MTRWIPTLVPALLAGAVLLLAPDARAGKDDKQAPPEDDEENQPVDVDAEIRKAAEGRAKEGSFTIQDSPIEATEVSCVEGGDGEACYQAGLFWNAGPDGKPDKFRADNFFRSACAFGHARGCWVAGRMHLSGEAGYWLRPTGTVTLDFGTAATMLTRSCELGHLPACGLAGDVWMAPDSFLPGDGTDYRDHKADLVAARQNYQSGCPSIFLPGGKGRAALPPDVGLPVDGRSCRRLSDLWLRGMAGGPSDLVRASGYADLACEAAGDDEQCTHAEDLADRLAEDPEGKKELARRRRIEEGEEFVRETTGRGDGALAAEAPTTERFDDPSIGIRGDKKQSPVRVDIHLGIGARWTYGNSPLALGKFRVGATLWFGLLGIGIDTAYSTDNLFLASARTYGRFFHGGLVKLALPLPIRMPIPARLLVVAGVGGGAGTRSLNGGESVLVGGLREMVQLVISSPQDRGARQWGAIRFEQQQGWHRGGGQLVEHSSQLIVLVGFTAGGVGPVLPQKKAEGEDE